MGKIAEALRANLQAVASSDARSLRELDQELRKATAPAASTPQLMGRERLASLLGQGNFQQQTVATLKRLCREHGITGYSKLRKAELVQQLERHGVMPPPRPLESLKKTELIALVRRLLEDAC
jgi:geranylgeranyl pyrophosphate synthase